MMDKHNVEYIDLPISNITRQELAAKEGDIEHPDIQDRGECVRLEFVADDQKKRAGAAHPRIGTLEELKIAFVAYLKEEKPELLECKIERYLEERGHTVLWTPPYCPELQPIELFWAAGKNHVALQYTTDTTMRDIVKNLREGWYGDGSVYPVDHPLHKRPVDCRKLWSTCLAIAGTKFVSLCEGISGVIGNLVETDTFTNEPIDIPIDTLVTALTRDDDPLHDWGIVYNV